MVSKATVIDKAINMAVNTGKTVIGAKRASKAARIGKPKAFVIAANCPDIIRMDIEYNTKFSKETKIIIYPKSSKDLGIVCGRPHKIAVLTIFDEGDSKILEL